jgi:hypothetical protein
MVRVSTSGGENFEAYGAVGGAGRVQLFPDGIWVVPMGLLKPVWLPLADDEEVSVTETRGVISSDVALTAPRWNLAFSVGKATATEVERWVRERGQSRG